MSIELSVVVPCYNDAEVLPEFYTRTRHVLEGVGRAWEIVFVNDGSPDPTWSVIVELCGRDPRLRGIDLSRNFGHMVALSAGLDHAGGDLVITLDSDLQDPPELIPELLKQAADGADVVHAVRTERAEGLFKRVTAAAFYGLFRRVSPPGLPANTGEYRLLSRRAVDALRRMEERRRFLRGLAAWVGFRQATVAYQRAGSRRGGSGFTLASMIRLAVDALASFSLAPLRLALGAGILSVAFGLCAGLAHLALTLGLPERVLVSHTTAFLIVALSVFSGIQLVAVGVLGEYVGRIYEEVRRRPLYLVQERIGLQEVP